MKCRKDPLLARLSKSQYASRLNRHGTFTNLSSSVDQGTINFGRIKMTSGCFTIRAGYREILWALVLAVVPILQVRGAASSGDELFTNAFIPHLQIEISPDGMKVLKDYQQVWGQKRPERIDVKATVREGDAIYTNVAIHLKGSFTFQPINEKPSLTLNFDRFADGQRFRGLDKIHVNNSVQDPTYLCEKLARELFASAGVPATRIGHARVSLNGKTLGFYVLVEGYNKRFLKRHFKSTRGNLYDGGSGGDITKALEVDAGENPDDRSDLAALLAAARETNASVRLSQLEQQLDVDRFLTFAALEVLLQHWDGYCMGPNNYRLFRDVDQGRMVFLPHGLDQILGVGLSPTATIIPQWDGVVARGLFSTPAGRQRYLERISQLLTNQFQLESMVARVDRIAAGLRRVPNEFLDQDEFQQAVSGLKTRIARRVESVRHQLANPEKAVTFPEDGVLRLTNWQFRRATRGSVSATRRRDDGRDVLQVGITGNSWTSGSWRKLILLEAGHYELSGVARAMNIPAGATNSGVIFRVSGERDSVGLVTNADWTPLRYEFEVPGLINVELVCEFRGPSGVGMFDASSLTLRRKRAVANP